MKSKKKFQNLSRCQKVRHYVKKVRHYVKKFVMTSKRSSLRQKVRQEVRHDVKNMPYHQNVCHDVKTPQVKKFDMT